MARSGDSHRTSAPGHISAMSLRSSLVMAGFAGDCFSEASQIRYIDSQPREGSSGPEICVGGHVAARFGSRPVFMGSGGAAVQDARRPQITGQIRHDRIEAAFMAMIQSSGEAGGTTGSCAENASPGDSAQGIWPAGRRKPQPGGAGAHWEWRVAAAIYNLREAHSRSTPAARRSVRTMP